MDNGGAQFCANPQDLINLQPRAPPRMEEETEELMVRVRNTLAYNPRYYVHPFDIFQFHRYINHALWITVRYDKSVLKIRRVLLFVICCLFFSSCDKYTMHFPPGSRPMTGVPGGSLILMCWNRNTERNGTGWRVIPTKVKLKWHCGASSLRNLKTIGNCASRSSNGYYMNFAWRRRTAGLCHISRQKYWLFWRRKVSTYLVRIFSIRIFFSK